MKVTYSSNNSGGDWWLNDQDWKNLETAGWTVHWVKDDKFFHCDEKRERWLGALATKAEKDFPSIEDGISEWERITGQDAEDPGCSCCGQPHNFYDW